MKRLKDFFVQIYLKMSSPIACVIYFFENHCGSPQVPAASLT